MAVIYLKHPVHGAKVATMDQEAAYDEKHGWVRFDPNEPDKPSKNAMRDPLDHDDDGRKGGSLPRRGRPPKGAE